MAEANVSAVQSNKKLFGQISKFAVVGVLNTLIDVGIVNILHFKFGVDPVQSNVVGVSVAIVNSYVLNKLWTFGDKEKDHMAGQFGIFVILSLIGLAVNTAVFKFLLDIWLWPGNLANSIVALISLDSIFGEEFVVLNFAKAWAIGVSMIWNFVAYRKWAFKN